MRGKFRTSEKIVRNGNIQLKITSYYLAKSDAGLRLEVKTLTTKTGTTVEFELLHGDNQLVIKKTHRKEMLAEPKKMEIADKIEDFLKYAYDKKLIR